MLIGKGSRRPNREKIRNIKEALGTALNLPEETAVTVTELTCLEEGWCTRRDRGSALTAQCSAKATQNS